MASSKLMASSASRNSDHISRMKSSPSSMSSSSSSTKPHDLHSSVHHNNGSNNSSNNLDAASMTVVDGFFHNLYKDTSQGTESTLLNAEITLLDAAGAIAPIVSPAPAPARKTADDVWREIVEGKRKQHKAAAVAECKEEMMTLEDFLVKAGAVEEEAVVRDEVKVELGSGKLSGGIYVFDAPYMVTSQQSVEVGFGNEMEVIGSGRGKRKAILEPLDKTMMQRQRRMIKNRESAARSRERKQAYQVELESMVFRLEEENEQLLKEKAERTKKHFKQIIEKVIPVVEKRRPPCVLRRVQSMQWQSEPKSVLNR